MRKQGNKLIISFFIGMFIMTIMARIMDSITIAKVQTNIPQKNNLTYRIQCEGEVESRDMQYLKPEPGLVVEKQLVQTSQEVKVGDPLYQYDRIQLADIMGKEQAELKKLTLELQKQQLQAVADEKMTDSYLAEQALLLEQKNVEIAQTDKNHAASDYEKKIGEEQNEYEEELEKLENMHEEVLERIEENKPEDGEEKEEYEIKEEEENRSFEERKQALIESHQSKQEALLTKTEIYADKEKMAIEELGKARITLENAQMNEQLQSTNQKREDQITSLDTAITKMKIVEKEQEVSRLQSISADQGLIKSPYEGIVTKSELQIGKTTTGEELLEIGTLEGIFICNVETEDCKYLKNGDQGTIRFDGKEEAVDATTVNKQTQIYKTCIPISALCEDSEGVYCMKAEEENSVLGNTLTAVRVNVEILEKDSQFAAVSGELEVKDHVITNVNKSVRPGDRVRVIQHD